MTKIAARTFFQVISLCALVGLFWLVPACGGGEPEVSDPPDYQATVTAGLTKISAAESADQPPPEAPPNPTPTVEPTAEPTDIPPTPTPTTAVTSAPATPEANGTDPLAPLTIDDANAFLGEVSEAERNCLSESLASDRLASVLRAPDLAPAEDRSAVLGCVEHDTVLRLLLTPVLAATGTISAESSACLRESFADADLHTLTANLFPSGDPGSPQEAAQVAGMVAFFVSLSCLSADEFDDAASSMGIAPGEYENFQCVLERVGGQDALTVLLTPASEFPAELFEAALECQFQMAVPPPG